MTGMTTYSQACDNAATAQGLDPIMSELRSSGIPTWLDQTGGFCMTVAVYLDEGHTRWIWLTDAAEWLGGDMGERVLLCLYDAAIDDGCQAIAESDCAPSDVADAVREMMRNA